MTDPLTPEQVRVLGCLVEKERTTPDQYPLTTNSLAAAASQRTNRDPVVDYDERIVDATVRELRELGLARTVLPTGTRTHRHRHVLDEAWAIDEDQLAVLAVLMLRGAQTPGELRSRTERYVTFTELGEVEAVLTSLAAHDPPFVVDLGRGPGQSQDRWMQTLGGPPQAHVPVATPRVPTTGADGPSTGDRQPVATAPVGVDELLDRLGRLEVAVHTIARELGIDLDDPPDRPNPTG